MIASASACDSAASLLSRITGRISPQLIGDGSSSLVSKRGAMLEAHAPLGAGQRGQPIGLDHHVGAALEAEQPAERDQGEQEEQRGRSGISPESPVHRRGFAAATAAGATGKVAAAVAASVVAAGARRLRAPGRSATRIGGRGEEGRALDLERRQSDRRDRQQQDGGEAEMGDPAAVGRPSGSCASLSSSRTMPATRNDLAAIGRRDSITLLPSRRGPGRSSARAR